MKVEIHKRLDLLRIYIPFIILALILIVGAGRLWYGCWEEKGRQDAIDGGIIVEAEIVSVTNDAGGGSYNPTKSYVTWYQYIDENGIEYHGIAKSNMYEKEAESYRGTKVNIYIDGRGNSIIVGHKTSLGLSVMGAIILTVLSVGAVGFDIWLMFFQGKKSNKKEAEDTKKITQKNMPKGKRRV